MIYVIGKLLISIGIVTAFEYLMFYYSSFIGRIGQSETGSRRVNHYYRWLWYPKLFVGVTLIFTIFCSTLAKLSPEENTVLGTGVIFLVILFSALIYVNIRHAFKHYKSDLER